MQEALAIFYVSPPKKKTCNFRTSRVNESFLTKQQSFLLWKTGIEKCSPVFDFVCFSGCHFAKGGYFKKRLGNFLFYFKNPLFTLQSFIFQRSLVRVSSIISTVSWFLLHCEITEGGSKKGGQVFPFLVLLAIIGKKWLELEKSAFSENLYWLGFKILGFRWLNIIVFEKH